MSCCISYANKDYYYYYYNIYIIYDNNSEDDIKLKVTHVTYEFQFIII